MTKLLKKAFERAAALPEDEQDAIASLVLEELEDESQWRARFAASQDALARLAAEARDEIGRGEIEQVDPATRGK